MKPFWNERYAQSDYVYGEEPNRFFKKMLDSPELSGLNGKSMLLPCEGEGRNALYAALCGWDVTAVDFSESGREKALKLAEKRGVNIDYVVADVSSHPFGDQKYDIIGLVFAHFLPEARKAIHRAMVNALKPGGVIILQAFGKEQLRYTSGGPSNLDMLYDPDEIVDDFAPLKCILKVRETGYLEEGKYHSGIADLVSLVFRKEASAR
jgi:SAM-dependent methyltransferase